MNLNEIIHKLEELGTETTKATFIRHGAQEPLYGVKVGDLKKIVKYVKKNQSLAEELYESGISDAMYLAGMAINPKLMSRELLQQWAEQVNWSMHAEYTVPSVAAESDYAHALAMEWMQSDSELIATCGWNTYSNYISVNEDEQLDLKEIEQLLKIAETTIHDEKNRIRYAMNGFVIAVGTYIKPLHEIAMYTAEAIGKVSVNMGKTACKVPLATVYIDKVAMMDRIGKKKKNCRC